jgi:WD40 repeat protein
MQVKNKCLIATDESGSVRVFNYPRTEKGTISKVYIEHLNEVFICVISKDERTMITVGREDKSIHFW